MQELAVGASTAVGYPAERFVNEGVAFIVTGITLRHHGELPYGVPLVGETWLSRVRRGTLCERELRLSASGQTVAEATQSWVHVRMDAEGPRPARASPAVQAAFAAQPELGEAPVQLPRLDLALDGPVFAFDFEVWHGWMDALGHVNHPVYVDWCDEGIRRVLAAAGLDPQALVPVAEQLRFRNAALASDALVVRSRCLGRCGGAVSIAHSILRRSDGLVMAEATTVRTLLDGPDALVAAFEGGKKR